MRTQSEFSHSIDFRFFKWGKTEFSLTPTQAACVRVLMEEWGNRTPEVGGETVLAGARSDAKRLQDVFRGHPAWRTLIIPGKTKGSYQLAIDRKF